MKRTSQFVLAALFASSVDAQCECGGQTCPVYNTDTQVVDEVYCGDGSEGDAIV